MDNIEKCVILAKAVKTLYDEKVIIQISGIAHPSVLMQSKAFLEAFPDHDEGEAGINDDGKAYRIPTAEYDGVTFSCVEYV